MGLFSRNQQEDSDNELLDSPGLPTSQDLNDEYFEPDGDILPVAAAPKPAKRALSYGIEDAIGLMRKLPRENTDVVVSVVKQTLESTQISIDDIIADATDKEERLLNKNTQLEREIKDLQAEIATRNKQIADLLADHKETVTVREQLQLANKLDQRNSAKLKQAAATAEPVKAADVETKPATTKTGSSVDPLPH
jgi:predicted phage tail protein